MPVQLSNEERVAISRQVTKRVAGRVPVVAGGEGRRENLVCVNWVGSLLSFLPLLTHLSLSLSLFPSLSHTHSLFVSSATFEGGLEEQARLMNEMGKYVDAVVIITNQICGMDEVIIYIPQKICATHWYLKFRSTLSFAIYQSDEVWLANVRKLMDLTGDLPLGLYETPLPQVR